MPHHDQQASEHRNQTEHGECFLLTCFTDSHSANRRDFFNTCRLNTQISIAFDFVRIGALSGIQATFNQCIRFDLAECELIPFPVQT